MADAPSARRPFGDFIAEDYCSCGFVVDRYDDGRHTIEYADPDSGLHIDQCPQCGRTLHLLGQR